VANGNGYLITPSLVYFNNALSGTRFSIGADSSPIGG
jgi:hypothetical protein